MLKCKLNILKVKILKKLYEKNIVTSSVIWLNH